MTRECENCGNHVSDQFARVFGDDAGRVRSCIDCPDMTLADLSAGAAADPARRARIERSTTGASTFTSRSEAAIADDGRTADD
ncbi:DUF7563 family protein [Natrinema marinum]|uniref:DUF7563 family protein n=1 Tax=Natrinema marinum TaxID=2961598 RepID=UPI003CE4C177